MVYDSVWAAAGMPVRDRSTRSGRYRDTSGRLHRDSGGHLCLDCLGRRMGRGLTVDDLPLVPCNMPMPWDHARLAQIKQGKRTRPASRRVDWQEGDEDTDMTHR